MVRVGRRAFAEPDLFLHPQQDRVVVEMITVVDYQMGNIGSIAKMIRKVGGEAEVTSDPSVVRRARKLILPGVGHFERGSANLHRLGIAAALEGAVRGEGVPVLGICLGMQLMCRSSHEAERKGLGWVAADVRRFDQAAYPKRKVPHMGWNVAKPRRSSPLFDLAPSEPQRFYFVHAYYVECDDATDVLTTTPYGDDFCSAFAHENMWGVQFHPEKSHAFGMELLRRFAAL